MKVHHTFFTLKKATKGRVGFVPTMGFLHEGHLSLIKKSVTENNTTIVSIYINKSQFNNINDYNKYPKNMEADMLLLESVKCDIVFIPNQEEIENTPLPNIDVLIPNKTMTNVLEGVFRPSHFKGVSEVMYRFLINISPDNLYMGQKDYQQCLVVKNLIDKNFFHIVLNIEPIIREPSGLAMSSRNARLSKQQQADASFIYQCLYDTKKDILANASEYLINITDKYKEKLHSKNFDVDYFSCYDYETLKPLKSINKAKQRGVLLVATKYDGVRLIDNLLLFDDA